MKKLYNKINKEELKTRMEESELPRVTLSFYKYVHLDDPGAFRDMFYEILESVGVFGRIYVSFEGVNGQISVPAETLDAFKEKLNTIPELNGIRLNYAIEDDGKSFYKLTIKVREKIVADGLNDDTFDVTARGQHIDAVTFNKLTDDTDTIVVDMRNHYESEVGHFEGAICPDVETFREALPVVEELLVDKKDKHIVMYCTGGIRCEKASAYFKHRGFENIYQLDGGIIEYARQADKLNLENKFLGKNFVFDERLGERISCDIISRCHQCGKPADRHVNCVNNPCHILFIQCEECAAEYSNCCSRKCQDFIALPEEQQEELRTKVEFNGTKFGKGRYKAHRKDEHLIID
jgi:UPF0176 protein